MENRIQVYAPERPRDPRMQRPPAPSADEVRQALQNQFDRWMGEAERYLADHPRTCVVIGLAVGVFLGWLIKRR